MALSRAKLEEQMTRIYHSTYPDVHKYVVSKSKSPSDIPDIIQNIYIKFYKRLEKRPDIEQPGHYIMKIAKGEIAEHYRGWYRDAGNIPAFSPNEENDFEGIGDIEAELSAELSDFDSELVADLWDFIKSRDSLTFQIFVLHFQYDRTLEDVAKDLNIKLSTVKNRLYRTIKLVRERYHM